MGSRRATRSTGPSATLSVVPRALPRLATSCRRSPESPAWIPRTLAGESRGTSLQPTEPGRKLSRDRGRGPNCRAPSPSGRTPCSGRRKPRCSCTRHRKSAHRLARRNPRRQPQTELQERSRRYRCGTFDLGRLDANRVYGDIDRVSQCFVHATEIRRANHPRPEFGR